MIFSPRSRSTISSLRRKYQLLTTCTHSHHWATRSSPCRTTLCHTASYRKRNLLDGAFFTNQLSARRLRGSLLRGGRDAQGRALSYHLFPASARHQAMSSKKSCFLSGVHSAIGRLAVTPGHAKKTSLMRDRYFTQIVRNGALSNQPTARVRFEALFSLS